MDKGARLLIRPTTLGTFTPGEPPRELTGTTPPATPHPHNCRKKNIKRITFNICFYSGSSCLEAKGAMSAPHISFANRTNSKPVVLRYRRRLCHLLQERYLVSGTSKGMSACACHCSFRDQVESF